MKRKNLARIVAIICLIVVAVSAIPIHAADIQHVEYDTSEINPIYEDESIHGDVVVTPESEMVSLLSLEEEYKTTEEAGVYLREQMINRVTNVEIPFETTNDDWDTITKEIFTIALDHTGNPNEGDYLKFQYQNYYCSINGTSDGVTHNVTITYTINYYTNSEQELEMTSKVDEVLSTLDLGEMTDYEKIKTIYDYVCNNVSYDYANLNDDTYLLKFTAYAALVNQTAVCQGYANLMYRLLLEAGIDTRIISGTSNGENHAWNIVKLGDSYYNVDATWDSETDGTYTYFLKNQEDFVDHLRRDEYESGAFTEAYPMSSTSYNGEVETEPDKEYCAMYRMYNPYSGEHFYTGSTEERDVLVAAGWIYEGIGFYSLVGGAPMYRLYNPYAGDHHYTGSAEERDMLVSFGWNYEGIGWGADTKENGQVQYRLFNPYAVSGSHHYTASEEEKDFLISVGWQYEGIGWYSVIPSNYS